MGDGRIVEPEGLVDHRMDAVRREEAVQAFEVLDRAHADAFDAGVLELQRAADGRQMEEPGAFKGEVMMRCPVEGWG